MPSIIPPPTLELNFIRDNIKSSEDNNSITRSRSDTLCSSLNSMERQDKKPPNMTIFQQIVNTLHSANETLEGHQSALLGVYAQIKNLNERVERLENTLDIQA